MDPNLERLIRLQQLDNVSDRGRRTIDDIPARSAALDDRLASKNHALETVRQGLADNQVARRGIEKEAASVQTRLLKYRDQLMGVKTNKEYQAMQKEIATAEREVKNFEDQILELMMEHDELTTAVKQAEADLKDEEKAIAVERGVLDEQRAAVSRDVDAAADQRKLVVAELDRRALELFEHIARGRKGIAVVAATDGHCSFCHVRLRPQVFNEIRRNESLIQCESCQRILYYPPPAAVTSS